ncbi:MAG: alpha/beta fold hydrolase [Bacteroidota bacterium]
MQKPAEHTFSYQNANTHYLTLGQGKPLVILHGWGSSAQVMMPLAQQLSDIRTCYVIDLPGFGDSPPPPQAWTIDDYADLIEAFLREVVSTPSDFLVHSFGGRIALKLFSRTHITQYVDNLLITGGAGMRPKRTLRYYYRKYTAKALKAPFLLLPGNIKESSLNWLRSTRLWKTLGSSDYQQLSGVMRETFVKTVTEHLESTLPKIDQEVLLLWGEEDSATPVYQAERMEQGLPNAALVTIPHAGHYAFLDQPDRFVRIARAFFKEADKQQASSVK